MKINLLFILILVMFSTLRAYYMMIVDKRKAIKQKWRTPERSLFKAAAMLGSLGIWLGMLPPVNHKKSKMSFILILVLITGVQIILANYLYQNFTEYFFFDTDIID